MIILRDKLFTLPDSRKGIGWVNDKNGKLDSEKYFRAAKKAAGRRVVESAKKHAPKINKHAGKIGIAAALVGAGKHYNKVSGKVNSAVVGAEVNTKDRIRKRDKKK